MRPEVGRVLPAVRMLQHVCRVFDETGGEGPAWERVVRTFEEVTADVADFEGRVQLPSDLAAVLDTILHHDWPAAWEVGV